VIEEKVVEKPKIKESVVKKERTLKFTQEQIRQLMKQGLI